METKFMPDDYWKSEIVRFFKGESKFSEEQLLYRWVNENTEHSSFFEDMRNTWLHSVTFQSEGDPLREKWLQMNERFNQTQVVLPQKNVLPIRILSFKRIASIAALLLVAMVIGAVLSRLVMPVGVNEDEVCEMITPLGAKSQIILPDGTTVWLNAGSRLTYKKSFNIKDRFVTLQGEAFFHVKTNKKKPFIVQTSRMNVKALGTTFNVKAYAEDKNVVATLVEGIIRIDGKDINSKPFTATLKPKETITLNETFVVHTKTNEKNKTVQSSNNEQITTEVLIHKNVNTEKFTSWKDAQWLIEAENLEDLSVLLGRRFNVFIHKQSPFLKEYRFTGTLQNETLEQVLQILKLTTPLKYKIGKGEVWWDIDPLQQEDYSKIMLEKRTQK